MQHWTRIYMDAGQVVGVAGLTQLDDERMNVAVVTTKGSRMEPGPWGVGQAQNKADEWATALFGSETMPSRWEKSEVTP